MKKIEIAPNNIIQIVVCKDIDNVSEELGKFLKENYHGLDSHIAFPGGSSVEIIKNAIIKYQIDTHKWSIFLSDERYVPLNDPDSNYFLNVTTFNNIINQSQFHSIDPNLPINQSLITYQQTIPCNQFDLIILGIGPDGHCASLFPQLYDNESWNNHSLLYVLNSPKPPPKRISFTLKTIQNAKKVIFIATGLSKRDIFSQICKGSNSHIPAAMVSQNSHNKVYWFVDRDCAQNNYIIV